MLQKLNYLKVCAQMKMKEFLSEERGDVNIVSIVVLIGIAVVLAVIFKDAIVELITNLLDTISSSATDAVTGP